jgi:nitrate reductase delta subunit
MAVSFDRSLKALSLLLSYPTRELQEAMPEIAGVLASEPRLTAAARRGLRPLAEALGQGDIYDVQETYVGLFDRSRSLSLNLFEHVHGESRDRGGAMVDLLETYREAGFEPETTELPDHLPVLLEYLALRPADEVRGVLGDAAHILQALAVRLERRESPYAAALVALVELSGAAAESPAARDLLAQPEVDPEDLAELDRVWEESEVTFGPDPNAGCPAGREILSRMDVPVTAPPAWAGE